MARLSISLTQVAVRKFSPLTKIEDTSLNSGNEKLKKYKFLLVRVFDKTFYSEILHYYCDKRPTDCQVSIS